MVLIATKNERDMSMLVLLVTHIVMVVDGT